MQLPSIDLCVASFALKISLAVPDRIHVGAEIYSVLRGYTVVMKMDAHIIRGGRAFPFTRDLSWAACDNGKPCLRPLSHFFERGYP